MIVGLEVEVGLLKGICERFAKSIGVTKQMFLYNFIEIFTVFYYSDYKSTVMNKVK